MRTFVISLSLLVITAGGCLWNFTTVASHTDTLYTLAESIPVPTSEEDMSVLPISITLERTRAFWEEHKTLFAVGISYTKLATVELSLAQVKAYANTEELSSFVAAREELLCVIAHLHTLERAFL